MDLYKAIQDLYAEKEKLERVIASLEELQRTSGTVPVLLAKPAKRRGRKSMSSEERQEVSERMRKYWAARRKGDPEAQAAPATETA
jgi:hypothetical protein